MSNVFRCLRQLYPLAALYGFLLALGTTPAQAQVFTPTQNISGNTGNSYYPSVVVDSNGNINVAWVTSSGIYYDRSTDSGQSFLPSGPIAVGNISVGAAFQPQMIVDALRGIIEIAWAKPSTVAGAQAGMFDVFVSQLTIGTVPVTTQVSPLTAPVKLVDSPRLAFVGTGVDVVWGNTETWIAQSPDGLTFPSAPIQLSIAPQDSGGPRIAVDKTGNIFVVWTDRLAQDQRQQGNLCTDPTGTTAGNGTITVFSNRFGGNVYLNETLSTAPTPPTPSSASTRSLSSSDWKGPDQAYPFGYFGCSYDSLQLFFDQNDNLHLLWANDTPTEEILTSTAVPQAGGPSSFNFPLALAGTEGASSPAGAADNNGHVYAVWAGGTKAPPATEGIYFSRSDNNGASFPQATVISAPGAISPAFPQIALDSNNNVDMVWEQADQAITANSSNTFHLFFAQSTQSTNGGTTFPTVREVSPPSVPPPPSVLCIPPTTASVPPTTPDTTTCGSVQMGVDLNSNAGMAWVDNSGSASNIDFAIANVAEPVTPDFGISTTTATQTAFAGQTVSFSVTTTQAMGIFTNPITLGCNSFPEVMSNQGTTVARSDFSCTASPPSVSSGGSATVALSIPPALPANSASSPYSFAINGTSGGTTHRITATFNDQGPAGSVEPSSQTIAVGASGTFSVAINPSAFTGTVNFLCSGHPVWVQCAFNPSSIDPSAGASSVLTVTVVSAPAGSWLGYPWRTRGLPARAARALGGGTLAALCLATTAMIVSGHRKQLSAAFLLRGVAVIALTLVLGIGLVSCGGAAAPSTPNPSSGSSGTGGSDGSATSNPSSGSSGTGTSSGSASSPVTTNFVVQAQSGNQTTSLGAVSITTP